MSKFQCCITFFTPYSHCGKQQRRLAFHSGLPVLRTAAFQFSVALGRLTTSSLCCRRPLIRTTSSLCYRHLLIVTTSSLCCISLLILTTSSLCCRRLLILTTSSLCCRRPLILTTSSLCAEPSGWCGPCCSRPRSRWTARGPLPPGRR